MDGWMEEEEEEEEEEREEVEINWCRSGSKLNLLITP